MIAQQCLQNDLLTCDSLRDALLPIGRDYEAVILLTAYMPNAERRAAIRSRHDAYVAALAEVMAEAVEASARRLRSRGRS